MHFFFRKTTVSYRTNWFAKMIYCSFKKNPLRAPKCINPENLIQIGALLETPVYHFLKIPHFRKWKTHSDKFEKFAVKKKTQSILIFPSQQSTRSINHFHSCWRIKFPRKWKVGFWTMCSFTVDCWSCTTNC
jgi:hypothetical protein